MFKPQEKINQYKKVMIDTSRVLLPYESNLLIKIGWELLKDAQTQLEIDQILVGTILIAMWQNDIERSSDNYSIKNIHEKISLINILGVTWEEIILAVGKEALIDKTIPFEGKFSNNEEIQSVISTALSDIKDIYFEEYGILESMKPDLEEERSDCSL